ncbi:MAG: transcription-repair coupling factor, partial [Chloroflexota bacterium]|nr:transcription-repair coupling factor [Chloroflexota bacterium]
MNLSCLAPVLAKTPAFHRLLGQLKEGGQECRVAVHDAAKPYLLAAFYHELGLPLLVVTHSPKKARFHYEQLLAWCPTPDNVLYYPDIDSLPHESIAPDVTIVHHRTRILSLLTNWKKHNQVNSWPPLIVTCISAIRRKVPEFNSYSSTFHTISLEMQSSPQQLIAQCMEMGYKRDSVVELPGTISHRGGIVDIYPSNANLPLRIEFYGNRIESIRSFEPQTQRSLEQLNSVQISPTNESYINQGILFDYLPPNSCIVLDEEMEIEAAAQELDNIDNETFQETLSDEYMITSSQPCFKWHELKDILICFSPKLILSAVPMEIGGESLALELAAPPSYIGRLSSLPEEVQALLYRGDHVIIISQQAMRLSELLQNEGLWPVLCTDINQIPPPASLTILQGSIAKGWQLNDIVLITDTELFGVTRQTRPIRNRPIRSVNLLPDLSLGDYVVHDEHGIGQFKGLTRMGKGEEEREYMILEYAATDRLYVPTDQANHISRYVGSGGLAPSLSRLGTQEWARVKQRVKEKTRDIAQELITIQAFREISPGFTCSPDTLWQQELEAAFPYIETPDQAEVIEQVKSDMESSKPMDRLVCGDVGYGKTEVALRAAFKAVTNGKQVALLVPTTVLAQQHFNTFKERLCAFPVKISILSRFQSDQEQKDTIMGLAQGEIDICIGTHRLLQKDVAFKDLGLVVIDEEQRFGVTHKERLKQMRSQVDILSLSATPIPRTLHMSLSGLKDMSTMETPPEERQPIKTFVGPYSEAVVRQAIIRELERGGQTFFVHNRVQNIVRIANQLSELVPEALVTIAHGQMSEDKLEQVMKCFSEGKADVMVCTTIIQAGLDIANANTLIVNDADKLGLTQLYQLRGRVGRGNNRAYGYFFFTRGKRLTETAKQRLQTIAEASELSAGFRIAMKDLEIRGAGNLLGSEQSGHIAAVGYDLYTQLLTDAAEEARSRFMGDAPSPSTNNRTTSIDLPFPAFIPETYVDDLDTRINLYRRLARISTS